MNQKHRKATKGILQLLIAAVFCAPSLSNSAVKLYKWIDENGEVRYSDQLPTKDVRKKHQMLNEQGVVIDTKEIPRTREERLTEEREKKLIQDKLKEEKRQKAQQDKIDRVLLLTFSSEDEMKDVRDNRIEVIDSVIRLIKQSLLKTEEQVIILEDQADLTYVSKGLEVPGGLAQQIEHFTRKAENRIEQLRLKEEEKRRINTRFDSDLERYRFLKEGEFEKEQATQEK